MPSVYTFIRRRSWQIILVYPSLYLGQHDVFRSLPFYQYLSMCP